MKKSILLLAILITFLLNVSPVFAQTVTNGVSQIQTFIQSIIQVMMTLAVLVSVAFFVWGGIGYITSSGNPMNLEKSKNTIKYSAFGLAIVLGSFVLSNVVVNLATTAFGAVH